MTPPTPWDTTAPPAGPEPSGDPGPETESPSAPGTTPPPATAALAPSGPRTAALTRPGTVPEPAPETGTRLTPCAPPVPQTPANGEWPPPVEAFLPPSGDGWREGRRHPTGGETWPGADTGVAGTETETGADTWAGIQTETETRADTWVETETRTDTWAETGTDTSAKTGTETGTDTWAKTETGTETWAETETGPQAETGQRVAGLLLGLAAGDAAGWPAARHRAGRLPEWTRRLTRELDTFAEHNATTTLPVPIALNQPPEPLRLGPSDDAEWAAFTAEAVLRAGDGTTLDDLTRARRTRAAIDLAWNALADEIAAAADRAPEVESAVLPLRARISVRAGLGNLAAGLRPPATGHDNPHYFDDAACVRACVLAVAHPGDPDAAADLAEFDARYTQDGDGVHGARAMAAAVSLALSGAGVEACATAALTQLPEATEIGRNARHALHLARTADSAFALVPLLEHQIVDHVYSYGIAAAETVPVALALALAAHGRIAEAVPAAACLSRVADSAPALAGALTGALGGGSAIPDSWRTTCRTLSGCALPRLTGTDLVELAGLLVAAHHPPTRG
ncbi:ADP-ribosylglycohydrolase family protein [Streptomyces sp. bgisy159]|uniref:ADP-ribosylglycohydrolase family protein n=1 Tax=Streptomyces sp. bgisy159 TaxID=3413795 RepID=UPI003F4A165D